MATELRSNPVAIAEVRTYYFDFTDDLPSGVTVSSATATHTPPSGSASTPTVTVSSPTVAVTLGPLTVTGYHYLTVLATLSNSDKSSMKLKIPVIY